MYGSLRLVENKLLDSVKALDNCFFYSEKFQGNGDVVAFERIFKTVFESEIYLTLHKHHTTLDNHTFQIRNIVKLRAPSHVKCCRSRILHLLNHLINKVQLHFPLRWDFKDSFSKWVVSLFAGWSFSCLMWQHKITRFVQLVHYKLRSKTFIVLQSSLFALFHPIAYLSILHSEYFAVLKIWSETSLNNSL